MSSTTSGTASAHHRPVGIDDLLGPDPPPFALLRRRSSPEPDRVEILTGSVRDVGDIGDLPLDEAPAPPGQPRSEMLALLPYRQITERGFACIDDNEPILGLLVEGQGSVDVAEARRSIPDRDLALEDTGFDIDDRRYAGIVERVLTDEIGRGTGSNFVIKRSFTAKVPGFGPQAALALFRRLLAKELGTYWTFLVWTGDRAFVGASPERHVSVTDGRVVMNPISGTYRYGPSGASLPDLMEFLADEKETEELHMVLDEELKMMARVCDEGGRVVGPYLKEMSKLAHTEYLIEGRSSRDVREILRETMFAPTVTGSPVENACRVIARHEQEGRGYYSGAVALIGRDAAGGRTLDSSILIRTARIDPPGRLSLAVGATLVRQSQPDAEVAETHAKLASVQAMFRQAAGAERGDRESETAPGATLGSLPEVREALARRNDRLAPYWLDPPESRAAPDPALAGKRGLVIDAEDTFTAMLGHQLRAVGLDVAIRRYDELPFGFRPQGLDVVVMGPGPGDPQDASDPKMATLRRLARRVLAARLPLLAVCLGHQVVASLLGLELWRKPVPNQGAQQVIGLFGRRERVGFYNTYVALADSDVVRPPDVAGAVELSRDPRTREVHALRGPGVAGVQFHPESVLTEHGVEIARTLLTGLVGGTRPPASVGAPGARAPELTGTPINGG